MEERKLRLIALLVSLLFVACAAQEERTEERVIPSEVEGAPAVSTTGGSADPAPDDTQREITIASIEVANPLVVAGRARTFENNVVLRVRDARGMLITEDYTTSDGEIGHHNPYRAQLWLTREPGAEITVEALEYSAKDGSERSLVREKRAFDVEPVEVTLRVPNDDCTGLVTRKQSVPKSVAMARLLVEVLLDLPVFPKGSAVRSVNLRDGVLTVDFNERLQNVGGSCAAQMIRASVTETLTQLPTVKRVVITAGGSESLALQP